MKKRLSALLARFKKRLNTFITRKPFLTLLVILLGVFVLIAVGSFIRKPKTVTEKEETPIKDVSVYRIGAVPRIKLQAQIEKSSVVTITSLMGGVVQNISALEGAQVTQGQTLVSLSTNYQGGNTFALQRELARKQYENIEDTYETQKNIIDEQKSIATETHENTVELLEISERSIGETQSLLDYNTGILTGLEELIVYFESQPSTPETDQTIISLKSQKSQFTSANNQLNSSLRNTKYQTDSDNPPTELADLQKSVTIKQLDIQKQALKLQKEVAKLQYQIAQVNEALMYPSAPFTATIQKVFVRMGQVVTPGTPLMLISGLPEEDPITAVVYVTREMAQSVSRTEATHLRFGDKSYDSAPSFVSSEAVQGTLYAIYYPIPDNFTTSLTDKGYIEAEIPIGYPDTNSVIPFIPIDSVYQTEAASFVFVGKQGKATSRKVILGQVMGRFVEVVSGLNDGDVVILDRTIIEGDTIRDIR